MDPLSSGTDLELDLYLATHIRQQHSSLCSLIPTEGGGIKDGTVGFLVENGCFLLWFLEREGEGLSLERAGEGLSLEREGEGLSLERAGEGLSLEREGEGLSLEREGEGLSLEREEDGWSFSRPLESCDVCLSFGRCLEREGRLCEEDGEGW